MQIINSLIDFFGINNLEQITTFGEFIPWFVKIILALLIVCYVFELFFYSVNKIVRGLK